MTVVTPIQVFVILAYSAVGGFATSAGLGTVYYKLKRFFSSANGVKNHYALDLQGQKRFNRYILTSKLLPSPKFYFLIVICIILWVLLLTNMVSKGLILSFLVLTSIIQCLF